MTMTLAIILAIISLWPLANYLLKPRQDPFNPLIFVGATTFFVTDFSDSHRLRPVPAVGQ